MQIVINITEDDYIKAQAGVLGWLGDMIMSGTPLPKGHGRLIDADDIALIDEQFYTPSDYYVAENAIDDAPTIIEADTESGEQA